MRSFARLRSATVPSGRCPVFSHRVDHLWRLPEFHRHGRRVWRCDGQGVTSVAGLSLPSRSRGEFSATERWMKMHGREITTGICVTQNDDVKLMIEGKRVRSHDGTEVRVGGIPCRILTAAPGVELYPEFYGNRPESKTKIYTLYAFDF